MNPVVVSRGLASEEDVAAVVAALTLLRDSSPVVEEPVDVTPPWRFSGRWFSSSRFA